MSGSPLNLPRTLFVPVLRGKGGQPEAVKAVNPEGKQLPIAFTSAEFLKAFAGATGLDKAPGLECLSVDTAELLDQLAAHHEPELCVDAMQPSETTLNYTKNGAVSRQYLPHGTLMDVRPAAFTLPEPHLEELRRVARSIPTVEAVWLMEMALRPEGKEGDPEVRPLLVMKQSVPEGHPDFQDAFMEMGDQWCENLPRGLAVDMLPDHAQPVLGLLRDELLVFRRS
jgi:hypothetical protein